MPLQPGDLLGPYEIEGLLGAGGMGEVYRARDTRLGREVALKVISAKLVGDPSSRRRFEIEARAASALNHPAIVTVYDVGDTGGTSWIAMEWVEGQTLRQALFDGPLPLGKVVAALGQIADGLAAAHDKGIVHRDLKPENVMLTPDGRSKVLDFGLARRTHPVAPEGSGSGGATLTAGPAAGTVEGAVFGTVGYMSPEQASGLPVDHRSDQFALGLIGYEMLTGQRAFSRATAVETLAAIIREEVVPVSELRADIPEPLQSLIGRCLAKHPEARFPTTREIATELETLRTGLTAASVAPTMAVGPRLPPAARRLRLRRKAIAGAAAILGLVAVSVIVLSLRRGGVESLAVLPFESAGRDEGAEFLGDGLAESLIDQLSTVPRLKVMARATSFRYRTTDPQEAGRKLGVGAVLTGRVSRHGDQLSISAELISVADGVRLWGATYDRRRSDLIRVQDSLASDIVGGLRLRLSGEDQRTLTRHGTSDPAAYELALEARQVLIRDTEEDTLQARRLYQQALEKDPRFVDAHLGVAVTYARSAANGWIPREEAIPQMLEANGRALELDPGNALVRCAEANRLFLWEWDWKAAERAFAAVRDDPRIFQGEHFRPMALYHWARGRPLESVAIMEQALRVDPGNQESRLALADFQAQAGLLTEATASYRALARDEPDDPWPLHGLAEVLRRRGDIAGAIETLRKAYQLEGEETGAKALAGARTEEDFRSAQTALARARLTELEAVAKQRPVPPLDLARLQAQVGERDRAFASLEAALLARTWALVLLRVDPAWDRIRDDPRFGALVRKVGIP